MIKKIIILLPLLISAIAVFSQVQNRVFNEITYKNGLIPYQNIFAEFQDSKGFIWIGGGNGLQRYDGYEFKNYDLNWIVTHITEDRRGILWISTENGIFLLNPENDKLIHLVTDKLITIVYKVIEDKNGIIWCATNDAGLVKLEPKTTKAALLKELIFKDRIEEAFDISVFRINENDPAQEVQQIWDIHEDSQGRLWIASSAGLNVFNKETHVFARIGGYDDGTTGMDHPYVYAIVEENPDVFWVRTLSGISRISNVSQASSGETIDGSKLRFKNYSCPGYSDIQFPLSNSFYIDSNHNIWLATPYHGLVKMKINENQRPVFEEVYTDVHDPRYLFGAVYSLMKDKTGLLWVSHEYKGIRKFRPENDIITPLVSRLVDFPMLRYDFNQITEDDHGNLWICSWGKGLFRITADGKVSNFSIADPVKRNPRENYTISMAEINNGIFWVGGIGIWQLDTHSGICTKIIESASFIDNMCKVENYILIGTRGEGLWIYDLNTHRLDKYTSEQSSSLGFTSNQIISVNKLQNGEVWVSMGNNGLIRLKINKTTGNISFLPLPEAISMNNKFLFQENQMIYQIIEESKGILWFATSNGLVKLDLKSNEIRRWTKDDGLPWSIIYFIEQDNKGHLWLGTPHWLSVFDPITEIFKTFDEHDGLPEIRHSKPSHFKTREGLMYFGGVGGFYRVNPEPIKKNDVIPPVAITDFRLFNKPVAVGSTRKAILTKTISYTQKINLAYNQNDISFTFAVLDYHDPFLNKLAYKLEGYQNDWITADAGDRTATFTNLSPGEYTLRVKGSNNDGIWNEEGSFIHIRIHPPFWRTTLAYIVYGILFLLLLRGFIYWRTRQLFKEKTKLREQVEERTDQLNRQKEKLQELNTLLEDQKVTLIHQKEDLQFTLENLRKTQEQLIESEKMAAIGGLVAGVAHEINTPVGVGVTAISNLLDDIQKMAEKYEKDEISRKDFREFLLSSNDAAKLIQKNLERTALLVDCFKQLSADQITEQQREFALSDYLNDILVSLRPKFKHKMIDFRIECDDELILNSYPGVYALIFTQLLINSIRHGFHEKEKGTITIKADFNTDMLKIHYMDDGHGISKKDLPHIFEPFYTSDERRGTGLGLNIVYNLVKQKLHGTISCESEPGEGAMFKVEVPAG